MIEIENLYKHYRVDGRDVPALDNVSLRVAKGEVFGIIGRSGAGKSTLVRCLNLLERPDRGAVRLGDTDLTALDGRQLQLRRQRIGMVFQHFNLLKSRTVAANVRFPLELAGGVSAADMDARVEELLALVGLSGHRDKYPAQLSGGQKQRVGIARALANHPELLLCDEATSALDPETTDAILALLADINRQLGLTIVLITHEMRVIRQLCDQVAVLDHGRVVEQGPVLDVFLHPQHEVTRGLLAETGLYQEEARQTWQQRVGAPLIKLTFVGDPTLQPVLDVVGKEAGARFNLVSGTLSEIKGTPFGQLVAGVIESEAPLESLPELFARQGVRCEVL
ncbi:D-methionine transport system ATP-binding protein [Chromobacterium alkanivorans]|uniref:methionine ABC transporter ATP-binding protein n=1 Tax=Chromobacterium TaxID=535 RepID=UPI000653994A|nr:MULTISPECIES: ATP-binding cassette domain-containing protein [Chromobacterium]KMN82259.1 methionine ABC transporter ATP-binding protein [Chromobacterium sp. LK11]MBN3003762.1 ATP-binding cassette domain-containing protein [Chromobacterium alkanivorans]MCS3805288.1 D-methionine transport system ATP-binding protein [Chromobacterium alkanivorans]MCS3819627.1 D-methionine transport system ATP-binding protein [Chromobacterium alkanivorans]MCS3874398.1 D-methionine transport system ATP-binding pr